MAKTKEHNLIVILGPTASGKTALSVRLAADLKSEVISADSRQVYLGMDIGTGKDLHEYSCNGTEVPYHLIDIISPEDDFSVFEFQRRFYEIFQMLRAKGIVPVMAGGTGLYLDSVLKMYKLKEAPVNPPLREELNRLGMAELSERLKNEQPKLHNTTDLREKERLIRAIEIALYQREHSDDGPSSQEYPEINALIIGLKPDRKALREKIRLRLNKRLDSGLIEEVKSLHKSGVSWERLCYFGLEYRYVARHLQGEMNRNDMTQRLYSAIYGLAKRQETWFRRMERNGHKINWINNADYDLIRRIVLDGL